MKRHLLLFALLLLILGVMWAQEPPTVTTLDVTVYDQTSATCGGTIVSDGGSSIIAYGVSYSTTDGFEGADGIEMPSDNLNSNNSFTVSIGGLTPATTYYVRAFAENEVGKIYAEQKSFTTLSEQTYSININVLPTDAGSVNVNPSGPYHYNDLITLAATPSTGYTFSAWDVRDANNNSITVTNNQFTMPESNVTVTATFTQDTYTITTNVTPTGAGSVSINPGSGPYHYNDLITLAATPSTGYTFSAWDVRDANNNSITVTNNQFTMPESNVTVTATFTQDTYTITTNVMPEGSGTVTGGGTYNYNAHVVLTAIPNPGYSFLRWDDGNTQNPRTITVTGNATYTATFSQDNYIITVEVTPEGSGTVTGGGGYHYGDNARLIATPNASYEFLSWNDGNTDNPRDIIVTQNATYTAHFGEVGVTYYNVTANVTPPGSGTVTGTGSFPAGSQTILTANPNTGYTFDHWQDGSQQNPRNVIVNGNMAFTAYFTQDIYMITVQVSPPSSGTVTGGGNYHYGEQATLNATANQGFEFDHWNDNITQNPRTITVTGNATYTAYFVEEELPEYVITTVVVPEGAGTVEGGGTYIQGSTATLIAYANEHYVFDHWNDDITQNPIHFTVTGDATYKAFFNPKKYIITTNVIPEGAGTVIGGGQHDYGEQIELTATAYDGYTFEKWQDGSTQNPRTITVTGDDTYTASFTTNTYTIKVLAYPEDGGSVSGGGTFQYGETCTVHATPNDGFTFVSWTNQESGQQVSGSSDYAFVVEGNLTLVANFADQGATIIYVDIVPEDGGTVTGAGIYDIGDQCTLKAFPKLGFEFVNWTMGDSIVSLYSTFSFTVKATAYYTAHFEKKKYTITALADPEEGGSIEGDGTYYYGLPCELKAIANSDYSFSQWKDGDGVVVSTESTYRFIVREDATYTAIFTAINQYIITVIANPEEGGTVSGGGNYNQDVTCTLSASPNSGYNFTNWTDENGTVVSTDLTYSFHVRNNATYTANFSQILQYTITAEVTPAGSGTVTGTGSAFQHGDQANLKATANPGYAFVHWSENGNVVSLNTNYTFTVTSDHDFIAVFKEVPCIQNLQEIEVKKHNNYELVLVYPNPFNEQYDYQWLYSADGETYSELTEGTFNKQYYYLHNSSTGSRLKDGYYKVRINHEGDETCKAETAHHYVNNGRLRIYPNPSRRGNEIVVMNDCCGPSILTIYSTDGRVLHTQIVTSDQATIGINLPQGVYVAYLTTGDGYTKIGKLIIQ